MGGERVCSVTTRGTIGWRAWGVGGGRETGLDELWQSRSLWSRKCVAEIGYAIQGTQSLLEGSKRSEGSSAVYMGLEW